MPGIPGHISVDPADRTSYGTNDYAARLIETAGLKGLRFGGALVSMQHANFIVNDQQACAKDIEMLIEKVQKTVADHTGVCLEPEVRFVGEHP